MEEFLAAIDCWDVQRIEAKLKCAAEKIRSLGQDKLSIARVLSRDEMMAIFEVLCNPKVVKKPSIKIYFTSIFDAPQALKALAISSYIPAVTLFAFDFRESRHAWTTRFWQRIKQPPTDQEFEWAVRAHLQQAIARIGSGGIDAMYLPRFWSSISNIISRLSVDQLKIVLSEFELSLSSIIWDRLPVDELAYPDIVNTIQRLLERVPAAFWQSFTDHSTAQLIERILNSPASDTFLAGQKGNSYKMFLPSALLGWVLPLMKSQDPRTRSNACQPLAFHLLDRFQYEKVPEPTRAESGSLGLTVIAMTLEPFTRPNIEGDTSSLSILMSESLARAIDYKDFILGILRRRSELLVIGGDFIYDAALRILTDSLVVESNLIRQSYFTIAHSTTPAPLQLASAQLLWVNLKHHLDTSNVHMVSNSLAGLRHLFGLQKFSVCAALPPSNAGTALDLRLGALNDTFFEILSQLLSARNEEIRQLFHDPSCLQSITSALVISEDVVAELALDLVKVAFEEAGRREAIAALLQNETVRVGFLTSYCAVLRTPPPEVTLSAALKTLKMSSAILNGLVELRSADVLVNAEALTEVTQRLWSLQWKVLRTLFNRMDEWTFKTGQKVVAALDFARDVIQFAKSLLDAVDTFAYFIGDTAPATAYQESRSIQADRSTKSILLIHPNGILLAIVKWLRIKDSYLISTITELVQRLLTGLSEASIEPNKEALDYVGDVVTGDQRTVLDEESRSRLQKALKAFGLNVKLPVTASKSDAAKPTGGRSTPDPIIELSKTAELYRQKQQLAKALPTKPALQNAATAAGEFKLKRQREIEAKKQRDARVVAQIRKNNPSAVASLTGEANELAHHLGVEGLDHTPADSPLTWSDDDGSSSSDEEGLFEVSEKKTTHLLRKPAKASKANPLRAPPRPTPVVKLKQARTAKDLRARITPNLASLHQTILQWDIFNPGRYPPGTDASDYRPVSKEFRSPQEYQRTFEPLLLMECWQGFLNGKEELNAKPFDIKIANRTTTGSFFELVTGISYGELKQSHLREADILVLSAGRQPLADAAAPHCLARVSRTGNVSKNRGQIEVKLRITMTGPMIAHLLPGAAVSAVKLNSLITLEREYGALLGLQYYDLCDEIVRAKPSPIIKRSSEALRSVIDRHRINPAQAQAVLSAWDNDGFTLVQGPPGTGKTKTIIAMAGGLLNDQNPSGTTTITKPMASNPGGAVNKKRLLICAPSNAAVDELIIRLRVGVILRNGKLVQPKVLRLGHSESAIPQVRDLTWEHQIDARMQEAISGSADQGAEIQRQLENIRQKSQAIEQLQAQLTQMRQTGDTAASTRLDEQIRVARNEKSRMGTLLDSLRDKKNSATRDMDVRRRKYQLEILNEAQIVCATLSGTGNEKLSNMTSIEFDTIIIDEAAQAIELSALIPLKYGCTKCILVGDPKQLPPTVFSMEAKDLQYEQSLFVRMQDNFPEDVHLLNTQYRMHPDISRFPSLTFYDNKLQDGPDMAKQRIQPWHDSELFSPYRFFDIHGVHRTGARGTSLINHAEAEIAYHLYSRLVTDWREIDFAGKIGIITPYKAQLELLRQLFEAKIGEEKMQFIDFNTIDAFQGRECEIIIYSCVRASGRGIGFLADIRRMNVALTRAKSSLWILGNFESLRQGKFWKDLLENAKDRNCYTDKDIVKVLNERQRRTDAVVPDSKSGNGPSRWPVRMDVDQPPAIRSSKPVNGMKSSDLPSRSGPGRPTAPSSQAARATGPGRTLRDVSSSNSRKPARAVASAKPAWPLRLEPGNCRRCNLGTHATNHCKEEVCMSCGGLGHSIECVNPNAEGAVRVRSNENQYCRAQDAYIERQKRLRMGEHAAQTPTIRVTSQQEIARLNTARPLSSSSPAPPTNGPGSFTGKRKRDSPDRQMHEAPPYRHPGPAAARPDISQAEQEKQARKAEAAAQATMGRHYDRLTKSGGISSSIASSDLRSVAPAPARPRDRDPLPGPYSGPGPSLNAGTEDNGFRRLGGDQQTQQQQPPPARGEPGYGQRKRRPKPKPASFMRKVQHNFGPVKPR